MTYIDSLLTDLRYELYCHFDFDELHSMSEHNTKVKNMVYSEQFLNRHCVNFGEHNKHLTDIIVSMTLDRLLEMKQYNVNTSRLLNKYILTDGGHVVMVKNVPDVYRVLYDFFYYFLQKVNPSMEDYKSLPYNLAVIIFMHSLIMVRKFSLETVVEYIKIMATSPYEWIYISLDGPATN